MPPVLGHWSLADRKGRGPVNMLHKFHSFTLDKPGITWSRSRIKDSETKIKNSINFAKC